jgi:hypothetical protein
MIRWSRKRNQIEKFSKKTMKFSCTSKINETKQENQTRSRKAKTEKKKPKPKNKNEKQKKQKKTKGKGKGKGKKSNAQNQNAFSSLSWRNIPHIDPYMIDIMAIRDSLGYLLSQNVNTRLLYIAR